MFNMDLRMQKLIWKMLLENVNNQITMIVAKYVESMDK
jgi:hypothetical protein